jgi:hypothetical protein
MYEGMMNFAYFLILIIGLLSLFGGAMSIVANLRADKNWNRADRLCERRDELYVIFIRDGWIPPKNHRFRNLYNTLHSPAVVAVA